MGDLVITPTAEGAKGRCYLIMLGEKGPGSVNPRWRLRRHLRENSERLANQIPYARADAKSGAIRYCRLRIANKMTEFCSAF